MTKTIKLLTRIAEALERINPVPKKVRFSARRGKWKRRRAR